jgi:hypothetical protein
MCRPPCCKPSHEGAGIAAVAVIIGAAAVTAKIGPAVARIWHLAVEALTIITITCAAAAAGILVTWAAARLIGQYRRAHQQAILQPVPHAASLDQAQGQPGCLACGGTGTVLRAIGTGSYQDSACPACHPVHRAG